MDIRVKKLIYTGHLSDKISIDPRIYICMWTIERSSQPLPVLTCKVLHEFKGIQAVRIEFFLY
jgi:hypothetical protein